MKKVFLLSFLCLFLLLFSGCNSKDNLNIVKFASWGSQSEVEIIKPLLEEFEKENPDIKVEFLHIPQNYFQKIHLLFASNLAPDVIFVNNLYLPIYVNANLLEDLSTFVEPDKKYYFDKSIQALSGTDGKVYAVPRDVSTFVVYYNKDLFDKYGVKYPAKKWTVDDFLLKAQKLTTKDTYGVSFESLSMYWAPFLLSYGGGIYNTDGKIILDNPKNHYPFDLYFNLANSYHVAPKKSESASLTMAQMFLQQKVAMHISGRWVVPKYRKDADFNWDVVTFPGGKAGSITGADASGWALCKQSKNKEKSLRLIKFLSSKDSSMAFTKSGLITPARKDVAYSDIFSSGKPNNSSAFINSVENAKVIHYKSNYQKVEDNINKNIESFINGKITSEDFLGKSFSDKLRNL